MSTSKGKVGPNSDLAEATGSVYPHLLLLLLQVLALSSPIFPSRRALFATVLASMAVLAHMNRFTNNPIHANFAALAWPHYLATIEKVLFCNPPGPETDLWRIDSTRQEALSFAGFGYRKIRWAVVLLFNLRGIRWNWEVKNVPKSQVAGKVSRGRFLLWQIVNLIGFVFMADLVAQLSIRLFFTSHDGRVGTVNSKYIDIRDPSWLRSFVNTLVFGAGPYYFINMQYIAVSIIFVALGISKPEDWPPFFGKLADVTTVRHFWGNFWHQMLRRMLNGYTGFLTGYFGIKRGGKVSSYTQLWLSFTISGIMHALSMSLLPYSTNITFAERTIGVMIYFLWQAAAITAEDFVQWACRKQSLHIPRTWRTLIGYVWVTASFWYLLPFAADVLLKLKMGQESPLPFTVVRQFISLPHS